MKDVSFPSLHITLAVAQCHLVLLWSQLDAGPTAENPPPQQSEQGKWGQGAVPGLSAPITSGHLLHFIPWLQVFSSYSMPVLLSACSQSVNRTSTAAEGPEHGWVSVCRAGGGSFLTAGVVQLSPRWNTAAGFSSMTPSHVLCLAVQEQHRRSRSRNVGQADLSLPTQWHTQEVWLQGDVWNVTILRRQINKAVFKHLLCVSAEYYLPNVVCWSKQVFFKVVQKEELSSNQLEH